MCTSLAGITIKLFVWAGIAIKTFGDKTIEESNCAMSKILLPNPGKV